MEREMFLILGMLCSAFCSYSRMSLEVGNVFGGGHHALECAMALHVLYTSARESLDLHGPLNTILWLGAMLV